ncbi:MAG: type II toxin-antitoxin system VapC family toxin [Actinomycetota bacterium]
MSEVVLDASALLALLGDEPGAGDVAAALPSAVISAVNLSEVVAKLSDAGMNAPTIEEALQELELEIAPFGTEDAYSAGLLRPATRTAGLGLGDRACLALADRIGAPVLTADRRWTELGLATTVRAIR